MIDDFHRSAVFQGDVSNCLVITVYESKLCHHGSDADCRLNSNVSPFSSFESKEKKLRFSVLPAGVSASFKWIVDKQGSERELNSEEGMHGTILK